VTYDLEDRIQKAQKSCAEIKALRELMKEGKAEDYRLDEQGTGVAKGTDLCTARQDTPRADHERSPRLEVLNPPWKHKDIQRFEDKVLVERHEERYSSLCGLLRYL
jgi:hypothetical protein